MKTKRFCKSTVSMILALIMLVSMCTVAFVNTAAAEADVATTGAGTTVYFQNNWKWTDVRIHVWDSNNNALAGSWPGATMTKIGTNGDYDYYKYTLPTNAVGFIFNGIKNDGSGARDQSPDMKTIPTNDHFYYMTWNNGNQCVQANESITVKFPSEGGGSTDPTEPTTPSEPDDPADEIVISFLINSDTKWVSSDDAKMFIKSGSDIIEMDETVDTESGHVMWTAEVAAHSSYTFYRTSYFFDKSNASSKAWNSWTASSRGSNTVFKATSSTGGSWAAASTVNAADPKDIENFWDDLWIDTKGEGNPEHAIKVYYNGSSFDLFVPSYVDLSNVTVYSDHEKVVIDNKEYASGSKANLTTGTKTFAFLDGSTTTNKGKLNIYQTTGTTAMLMTTKEELYTGTTAGLQSDNAWPSGSGITADNYNNVYKDAIETKGSVYFYKPDGSLINNKDGATTLKKIKGRGNSSFEASMRIYGKYAYNFNLDKKVAIIDGSTSSKKWSMLANNVDHSMMRNSFVYQLSDDLGLDYGPETLLVDAYDNGKYLGAFTIAEKVEYGGSTLMDDMENLDDGNVLANSVFVEGTDPEDEEFIYEFDTDDLDDGIVNNSFKVNGQTYKYKYYATYDRPDVEDDDGNVILEGADNLAFKSPENFNTEYNYLLEHELFSRYEAEASWFVTPKGQAVVVKYPEFATQAEMEWIIGEYAAMEQAVYNDDYATYSKLIDVDSFAKMYLIHELSLNLDSCATSYYIHNEFRNGKSILVAGPVWDFDWAFGSYAGNTKYIYNGSSVVNSGNMSNPQQMFVKNKALKTDSDDTTKANDYNLQAKLAQNSSFWKECKRIWTNDMAPLLYSYLIDDYADTTDKGTIVSEWLPAFQSSVDMNNARWGVYTFTGDDWGTKVTSDYTKGSGLTNVSNFKIGNTGSSGSSSKSYANTVYYLNDWLVVRRNYMSSSTGGGLYDATLLDTIELKSVTMDATQSGNTVTVNVTIDATNNGVQIADANKFYELFVNGESKGKYSVTEAATVTLEENVETKIYVVGYLTDDDTKSMESDSQKFTYTVTGPEYKVESVKFEAVQSADEATVTVTPSAVVTLGGEAVSNDKINYTVYLNGSAYGTYTFGEKPSVDVNLTEGIVNEIYIVVAPVDSTVKGTSTTEKFSYNVEVEKVNATLYFKASSSARYIPTVIVDGVTTSMTISGDYIGANATKTQKYYWYTATVEVAKDVATRLTFKNNYSMNATTTVTLSADATFYFGVDNMNNGTAVVDLTAFDENIRNFTKSATHMVTNDPTEAGVATTSIDGTIYKMGDADVDNTVSVLDATTIQLALAGKTELSDTASDISDFDLDQTTSIMDATNVQVYLASGN